jgi:hypothetical protein
MFNIRFYLPLAAILLVSACAPVLSGPEMAPKSSLYDSLSSPKSLAKNIQIDNVTAEKGLGGMTAPVTADQYSEALTSSLRQAGWYSGSGNSKYLLTAHLMEIDQPVIGFSFTVTAKAQYTLSERKTGKVRYDDVLTLPCTVTMSEAFVADVRLRKATACAVGENITHFLKVLSERY